MTRGPDFYEQVDGHLIQQAKEPVILHWLGDMFDAQLKGYWGGGDLDAVAKYVLDIINAHTDKIDGNNVFLLEQHREEALRARLAPGVRLYTGEDFNYAA